MEEKKPIKIHMTTIFIILALIVILIMGYFIFKLNNAKNEKTNTVEELNTKIEKLEESIENSKDTNNITTSTNTTNTTNENTTTKDETNKQDITPTITQKLTAPGYALTLYSNNDVTLELVESDLNVICGNQNLTITQNEYKVTGISGKISKMVQGNNGSSVDPITFFIMEDGTVNYIQPLTILIENDFVVPQEFNISGKIEDLEDVVDIKSNSIGVLIAVTKDGKEIKFMNEWMEEDMP